MCVFFFPGIGYSQPGAGISRPICIGEQREIYSSQLSEKRLLNIFLPESYSSADTTRYAVIYLLDGSADEDFIHVSGLVQFSSFPWVSRLPPTIVVGIANVDRKRDFTFPTTVASEKKQYPTTGGAEKFVAFLESEVKPYITSNFRTTGSSTIIGESLGGLLAADILLTKPDLFDKYIIISPSIWWDNGSLLEVSTDKLKKIKSPKDIFIAVGKEGLTPSVKPRIMEDDARLLKKKLASANNHNLKILFDYLPGENHATIAHQAILDAFKMLAQKKG